MAMTRQPYPPEFRRQLVHAGRSPEQLAAEFEPTAESIRNWVAQSARNAGRGDGGLTTTEREELNRLRRENRQLRVEREILSKAAAWFARETNAIPAKGSASSAITRRATRSSHVQAAGCLLQRLLRMGVAAAIAPVRDGRCTDHGDPCRARSLARHLRCATGSCRARGQG